MRREPALKFVLAGVGLLFCALAYPMVVFLWEQPALAMMLSLYVTLGVFLLLAARNPAPARSLIAFTAWSSFAHALVMGIQALHDASERAHFLSGSVVLVIIGLALVALAPAKATGKLSPTVPSEC